MENCFFPEDIMLCILTCLPVKSIIRFKSVCKPWRELFSTPEFVKMHHGQFSSDPKNQFFIVHRFNESNTMTIFNIESEDKKPTILEHPFAYTHIEIDIVGCCNGLVCISRGQEIVLWNPAMKLSKSVSPLEDCGVHEMVSLGFGYDAVGCDFKVVRFVCLETWTEGGESLDVHGVEVYSVNSDSWITINPGFKFSVLHSTHIAIVNGNPYWVAIVAENESARSHIGHVLVWFDVRKMVFKVMPLSSHIFHVGETPDALVDWNGSLGVLVCTIENKRVESLDVWVFDDAEQIWRKNHTFGPIEVNVDRFLLCLKNGKVLGECPDGKLFVFDPENGCVKVYDTQTPPFESYLCLYNESVTFIKGMRPVEVDTGRGR